MTLASTLREEIAKKKGRSAWERGVRAYANDLLDNLDENERNGWIDTTSITDSKRLELALLNGASCWGQFSDGGCSLIWTDDIVKRLCNNSEKKKYQDGKLDELNWLEIQARALHQAYRLISLAYMNKR